MIKRGIGVIIICIVFILLLGMFLIKAEYYNSQPDETASNDTYIRENSSTNYGTQETLWVGKVNTGHEYKSLIQFNISSINSENSILDAKLQLYVNNSFGSANRTLKIYRLNSGWDELTASWYNKTNENWTSFGGDYTQEINSTTFSNSTGIFYNFTITNLVRGWVNGTYDNYGIILIYSNINNGNYTYFGSSSALAEEQRPKLIAEYIENAAPVISEVTTNSSPQNPKQIGEQITFTVSWTDLESNPGQLFVCNSSSISTTGCGNRTFCNTSFQSSSPSSCSYTIQSIDNKTTTFYSAICDSNNCSEINESYFYMNHNPSVLVIQPNGGETVNQTQGNYLIKFNVSDTDLNSLTADIYYGLTQNSTTYSITSNLDLTNYCTDKDNNKATTNNCTYSWNSNGVYGPYYLTIIVNDSFSVSNDSSSSSFDVKSIVDETNPLITGQWIDSDIYSGKNIRIYANITEENINTVWISINTTPETNITMTNISAETFAVNWTGIAIGNYKFKVYANDTIGNINNSVGYQTFSIRKPNATTQNEYSPAIALPYSLIRITSELNSTDQLKGIYANLNVPRGFLFISNYSQNNSLGNFTENETKDSNWIVSVPLTEANYTLNITYTDQYSNSWNSSNFYVYVTSSVAGGGYLLSIAGYPEVETSNNYYIESYFSNSGSYTNPDSIYISIYDSTGTLVLGPASMSQKSTGVHNYTYSVGASVNEGLWETRINATKSSTNYYANEFWKVVGGPFDVRDINILDAIVSDLNISIIAENTGGANKDLILTWNLTRTDTNALLDSGSDTFMVNADSERTWYVNPSTSYIGEVKITFLGYYSGTEKAGAYETFTTTAGTESCGDGSCSSGESCSSCPSDCGQCQPSGGGGGGGGGGGSVNKASIQIITGRIIKIPKNIGKNVKIEIKNNGNLNLNNISLKLEGIESYSSITPSTIKNLETGKTDFFDAKITISDFIGEKDIKFIIKTNELTKEEDGMVIVSNIRDYFLEEINKLEKILGELQTNNTEILNDLGECNKILNTLKFNVEREEIISANENLEKANKCVSDVEKKIKKDLEKQEKTGIDLTKINIPYQLILYLSLIIITIMIAIFIVIYIRKKFSLINLLREGTKGMSSMLKPQDDFEERVKKIQERLE